MSLARDWLRHAGVRRRVTAIFVVLTMGLSAVAGLVVWVVVTHYLVSRSQDLAVTAARLTAASMSRGLREPGVPVAQVLDRAVVRQTTASLLVHQGRWYATAPGREVRALPERLVRAVRSGTPETQRIMVGSTLELAVGIPLGHGDAYFRLARLDQLQDTLGMLRTTLVLATVLMSLAALGIGWLASRIALRPLREMARVAGAAARGEPGVRLDGQDDPDLRELVASFNQTAEALEKRVVADARFAGDVSHELRTPVMTMLNCVQLIQNREHLLPGELREPVGMLAEDLERFRHLVVDLIEMSRVDGHAQLRREHLRVADAVRVAGDAAAGRPVTRTTAEAAEVLLPVDKRRLAGVVGNLVSNAEQHGGGCLEVRVSSEEGEVRIEVDDAGPGIPESLRERVFERFFRGIGGHPGGNGLGLAIVARHVQGHGGSVALIDRPGGGTRAVVVLPRDRR